MSRDVLVESEEKLLFLFTCEFTGPEVWECFPENQVDPSSYNRVVSEQRIASKRQAAIPVPATAMVLAGLLCMYVCNIFDNIFKSFI